MALTGCEMKRTIVLLTVLAILPHLEVARGQDRGRLVLPNPKLLRCSSSDCFQLWSEGMDQKAISPKQMIIDMDHGCIYGLTALYDKSVPLDRIKSEIDDLYKQWSLNYPSDSNLYIWRVESQKFAIDLSVSSKKDEKRNVAEAGTRQVIYIAFGGKSACGIP